MVDGEAEEEDETRALCAVAGKVLRAVAPGEGPGGGGILSGTGGRVDVGFVCLSVCDWCWLFLGGKGSDVACIPCIRYASSLAVRLCAISHCRFRIA